MDWNWFFSAVAQSCAAIVGIVGAFVFTKVIDNQSHFVSRVNKFREFESASLRLMDEAAIRSFQWVGRKRNKSELRELADEIKKDEVIRTARDYYSMKSFSLYEPLEKVLDEIDGIISKEIGRRKSPPKSNNRFGIPLGPSTVGSLLIPEPWDRIIAEEKLIDEYLVRLKDHIRRLDEFTGESHLTPEKSHMVSWVLILGAVLFFGGVIYPLSFLPVDLDADLVLSMRFFWDILFSLKGFVLTLVSILYMAIQSVLFVSNSRMRLSDEQFERLSELSSIRNYSEDLKILYDNQDELLVKPT